MFLHVPQYGSRILSAALQSSVKFWDPQCCSRILIQALGSSTWLYNPQCSSRILSAALGSLVWLQNPQPSSMIVSVGLWSSVQTLIWEPAKCSHCVGGTVIMRHIATKCSRTFWGTKLSSPEPELHRFRMVPVWFPSHCRGKLCNRSDIPVLKKAPLSGK